MCSPPRLWTPAAFHATFDVGHDLKIGLIGDLLRLAEVFADIHGTMRICADRHVASAEVVVALIDGHEFFDRMAVAETRYGAVSCKVCAWDGHISNVSVEYEDCRRLAEENGVPLKIVQREAMKEICTRLGE